MSGATWKSTCARMIGTTTATAATLTTTAWCCMQPWKWNPGEAPRSCTAAAERRLQVFGIAESFLEVLVERHS